MKALALSLLPVLLVACACAADDKEPPAPKLPLGKDTTFVLGPLDKHGYIDYETALNAEMSKGVTAQNNANALLVQAFGPEPEGGELPLAYYKWLDIPVLPKEGDYFQGTGAYVVKQLGLTGERLEAFYEFQSRATQRPWAADDCPPLAEWLKVNEKPLAKVLEATRRAEYFNPLVTRRKEGESSNLLGVLLPTVQKCRELAAALTTRAMLKLKDGKVEDAWADVLACHRLARLCSRGGTLIEALVGIAIGQIASNAALAVLDHPDLTAKQALKFQKDLRELPAFASLADKIGVCERMMGLDALQGIRRGMNGDNAADGLGKLVAEEGGLALDDQKKALAMMDWTTVMQTMNKRYDQMADAMRIKNRADRRKAFEKLEEEFKAVKKEYADADKVKKLMEGKDAGKQVGKALGEVLMSLLSPATEKVQQAHDRATQTAANLQ
ncbi:MAG: hypothetical protein K2V38_05325, partial [Gemmataceae bacterium]|nr:hypothetical protein [Gemmataceae bacterium]